MNNGAKKIFVGARVTVVPGHWLRGYEEGLIIERQCHAANSWLVKFDHNYPGGGIDGDKLWLDESQLSNIAVTEINLGRSRNGTNGTAKSDAALYRPSGGVFIDSAYQPMGGNPRF